MFFSSKYHIRFVKKGRQGKYIYKIYRICYLCFALLSNEMNKKKIINNNNNNCKCIKMTDLINHQIVPDL